MLHGRQVDQIIIDSKDKDSTSVSTTNFTIQIPQASTPIKHYQLLKVIIPLTYDTVTSSNNTFDIDSTSYSLDTGHYDIDALISALNDKAPAGFTFSWLDNSRVKVAKDDLTNFTWEPNETGTLLGYESSSYTAANNYTAEVFPNLNENLDYLTLHSDTLSRRSRDHTYHTDRRTNMLSIIPINSSHGSVQVWEPIFEKYFEIKDQHLNIIDFKILNKNKEEIDINNDTVVIIFNRY